ncbi:hypothetical protein [Altericista sp. CCNU0014]|uniref:hypothetical protein n=1 Tax=Altericista sp. CCNU0014 TaxID=3082949 RepID=UPI00384F071C
MKVSGGAAQLQTSSTIRSGTMGFAGVSEASLAPEPEQVVRQVGTVTPEHFANADGEWSLEEFVLFLVLQRRLDASLFPIAKRQSSSKPRRRSGSTSWRCSLRWPARGMENPRRSAYAFRCGAFKLPGATAQSIPDVPPEWTLATLAQQIERLRQAAPKLKQSVINACAHTVLLDSKVTADESELLRAVTIALDCPIPPFLNSARPSKLGAS